MSRTTGRAPEPQTLARPEDDDDVMSERGVGDECPTCRQTVRDAPWPTGLPPPDGDPGTQTASATERLTPSSDRGRAPCTPGRHPGWADLPEGARVHAALARLLRHGYGTVLIRVKAGRVFEIEYTETDRP